MKLKAIIKGTKDWIAGLTATVINEGESTERRLLDVALHGSEGGIITPAKEKICLASYTEDDISEDAIDLSGITGEINRIELNNDGVTDITITIGSISKTIKGGEFYNQNFAPFTSIGITGSSPVFRLDVLG